MGQADEIKLSATRQIADVEKQIETLLGRIMNATNDAVIAAYEEKIGTLEKDKVRLSQNVLNQTPPTGRYEEMIELSLKFLSSPWKIWESGEVVLRRTLLRLAFTKGFAYHRNEGHRAPNLSLHFKALVVFQQGQNVNGAGERRNIEPNALIAPSEQLPHSTVSIAAASSYGRACGAVRED